MSDISAACIPAGGELLGDFHVEFATSTSIRRDEYRLRYAVFVEERGWLDEGACLKGVEQDRFDDYAISFLLRDGASGEPAACQRLILPDRLPFGVLTPFESLASGHAGPNGLRRSAWAEVSRTTIAPPYRWGARGSSVPAMLAIKHASIALATAADRSTLFSVSDPRTARLVRRMGFQCRQAGDLVRYHGERALYRMEMSEILESVPVRLRGPLQVLTDRARTALANRPGPDDRHQHRVQCAA